MAVAEHLVGRASELGSLDQLIARIERGDSAALQLVGEPGIGKTRLLAELAARADARGHLVLSGSATELEQDLPFWVFVDALEEYVGGLEPRRLDALQDDVRTELATLFPSLSALAKGQEVAVPHERYRSHRAVRELLEVLSTAQPLALVLDDLHWSDPASVELVGALLNRPPVAPVLLAIAVRPRQMPERLAASLEHANRAGTLTRLELNALTRDESNELLGETANGGKATDLYEESGGNPFYLEQLVRALERSAAPLESRPEISWADVEVPPPVAAALAEELALLSDGARLVLQGAAVAGDPFEPELAAAAAATSEASTMDALDELLRLDLIRHTDVPRRFRFRHPLVRRAVYENTPGGWRLGAHERSAEALAARRASVAARAHHVERSARQGDLAAVATLREAGEAAAQRAPASAARWFSAALRILPAAAPADERVELLLALAGALAAAGHFAESHETLIESMRIVPKEADALRVRLTTMCASVEHLLGRHTQAHARLESALAELRDPNSPEAVALMIELAVDAFFRLDYDAMRGWAARAVDAAPPLGDRALTAAALAVRAVGGAFSGAAAEGKAYREEAAELIDELSDEEIARRLDALVHLATAEIGLDHFEASGRHGERALTIGRATGQGDVFPLLFPMLGMALWVQGRMAESCEVLDGAVEAARLMGNVQGLAWILLNRAMAASAAGDVEVALATATESLELAKDLDEGPVSAYGAVALAGPLLETGRAGQAADWLMKAAGGEELRLLPGTWRVWSLELLTRCLLGAGRREEAERTAEAAAACADAVALPMAAAMAGRAAAALALAAGDPASAAERALAAAVALEDVGDVFDAALSRTLAGRALAQAAEHDRAAAELQRAAAAFDSFGSPRYRAEAERELRKLGRPMHRRTRLAKADGIGVASLTERERQIALLVVDRRTNREIAEALFLSPKTVETHLRNIFRKLDVSSRVEVARAVERADHAQRSLSR